MSHALSRFGPLILLLDLFREGLCLINNLEVDLKDLEIWPRKSRFADEKREQEDEIVFAVWTVAESLMGD